MIVVKIQRNATPWQAVAAFACFVGAVLALAVGSLLTTAWVLNAELHPLLRGLGLTLLIVAIPILILGGHCLDLVDKQEEKARKSRRY
jgi:hypothetical protein